MATPLKDLYVYHWSVDGDDHTVYNVWTETWYGQILSDDPRIKSRHVYPEGRQAGLLWTHEDLKEA